MADLTKQLQEQIATARSAGQSLHIIGGNSKAFMGRTPVGEPINVAEHSGVVDYQPLELVMTVRAGTRLSEIEAVLSEQGQALPFEPPLFSYKSTIGGTLACNLSGPARPWSGSIRDHVLGVKLINGKAEVLRFGGQVMKNVAGYDVSRLQAGAMGTLGLMTEISLKVLPKPALCKTLVESMSAQEAIALMNARSRQAKPITAACWFDGHLYTRLAGAASAVESTVKQWSGEQMEIDKPFWTQLRDHKHEWFKDERPLWRFSIKPTAPPQLPNDEWLIDWGGAQRWLKADYALADMAELAAQAGGQVSLFRGGDRDQNVFHPQPPALQTIQKNLKASFDPEAILNPGRLYSWL